MSKSDSQKKDSFKAKPTTSPAGLLKYLNFVLDDIERLEGSRRFNPDVNKYIRTERAVAYNETKKCVEKIRTGRPEIKDAPAESDDPEKYLRNAHRWCIGLLYWENGERIGAEPEQKDKGSRIMITARTSKEIWEAIESEYDISKRDFGKKINFVSDSFKKKIIFRDVEHAFVLASQGFSKPALILAGGVIEELLRLYLEHKNIRPECEKFFAYIEACENHRLLKRGVSRLTDSIRDFRNLVHLNNEKTKRHTVSKATAKGAVSSIFTIANDFPQPRSN